jgi:uncharacterized SAM-binding protein YcdF (DUF218 family)
LTELVVCQNLHNMFFILSKVLNFLTNPLIFVFGFLIASVLMRKAHLKKRFFWIAFSLLLFFSNDFISNEAMQAWEVEPTPYASITQVYDLGIVLTGVTLNDREPADRVYFHHGADRVTHTIQLYKKGIIKEILIAGGSGRLITEARPEADEILDVMVMAGVPASDIRVERESRNTHESAVNVKQILKDDHESNYLLITSAFHMRRSIACFKNEGLHADVFSTDFYTHPRFFTPDVLLVPRADSISRWHRMFREWGGIGAYWLAGYI